MNVGSAEGRSDLFVVPGLLHNISKTKCSSKGWILWPLSPINKPSLTKRMLWSFVVLSALLLPYNNTRFWSWKRLRGSRGSDRKKGYLKLRQRMVVDIVRPRESLGARVGEVLSWKVRIHFFIVGPTLSTSILWCSHASFDFDFSMHNIISVRSSEVERQRKLIMPAYVLIVILASHRHVICLNYISYVHISHPFSVSPCRCRWRTKRSNSFL